MVGWRTLRFDKRRRCPPHDFSDDDLAATSGRSSSHFVRRQCSKRYPGDRAEHVGRNLWVKSRSDRRLASLAGDGFSEQRHANSARWCDRRSRWATRVYIIYQSFTDKHSHTDEPDDTPTQVVVTNNGAASLGFTVQTSAITPTLFTFDGHYVAATHSDGSPVGPPNLFSGSTTPAQPGEVIVLYANGFGQTNVPLISGSPVQSRQLQVSPTVVIGASATAVQYAGLISPGMFQFNVVVPPGTADGDQPVTAVYLGATTQTGVVVPVKR